MSPAHWSSSLRAIGACEEAVAWAESQPDYATAWAWAGWRK